MLQDILREYQKASYDFRQYACIDDPLKGLFDEWLDYYRMKWAIAKVLQPVSILEVGVRYGYSARAFLDAAPTARYVGLDADLPAFGGHPGALAWAARSLKNFNIELLQENTQNLVRLPGDCYDLVHIDGQQDGDGTFHDLNLALNQGRYILIDGYFWTRENFLASNEWLWLNKMAIEWTAIIPGYAGEMLIKTNIQPLIAPSSMINIYYRYTDQYYLNDCRGYAEWQRTKDKTLNDQRLGVVANVAKSLTRLIRVVDLGAGCGELSYHLAKAGAEVTAIDYSRDSVALIEQTFVGDEEARQRVTVVCDSVTNPLVYSGYYNVAVASDIIEHLAPCELENLYELVSQHLEPNGVLVVHTSPNLWNYRYEHPRQQKLAKQAGCWLPKVRRTYFERLMHINEQSPRVLKKQLARHFPYVYLWFAAPNDPSGSLLRRYGISDMRRATSLFAVASRQSLDVGAIRSALSMEVLSTEQADKISLRVTEAPSLMEMGKRYSVRISLFNDSNRLLSSRQPHPFHLSYHWEDAVTGAIVVFDGLRSPLLPPCPPGCLQDYELKIDAPESPGSYFLKIVPVQEMVRWHEAANTDKFLVEVINNVFGHHSSLNVDVYRKHLFNKGLSRPIMLICETVNLCNNECIICAYSSMDRKKKNMNMALFRKVLNDYTDMGGGAFSLTPVVGDVLLDRHLVERLRLLKDYDRIRPISVTTNLVALDRFDNDELLFILDAFDKIHISVYGLNAEDYLLLAKKDNYGKLTNALQRIAKTGYLKKIVIGFRLLRTHTDDEIFQWIHSHLGQDIPFSQTRQYSNWGMLDTSKSLPFDASWLAAERHKEPCLIPLSAMQVFSNGMISFCPCDDFENDKDLCLGDVNNQSLSEIYNSEKSRQLWSFENEPDFCKKCSFYQPLSSLNEKQWMFDNPLGFIGG
jgi:radical SAM protein with 4Fe4S-binding SPASM domain